MDDLRRRFGDLDAVAVPDLWPDIERRASSQATGRVRSRTSWRGQSGRSVLSPAMLGLLVGFLLLAVVGGILVGSWFTKVTPTVEPTEAAIGQVLGCFSIAAAECQFVAEQVEARLPVDRGTPFAIVIQLYGCPSGPCPPTLEAREGRVTIEYADRGEPIEVSVAGPPEAPRFGDVPMAWSGLMEPKSSRVAGPGPFPFELGHCGLTWYVDFDGSFWIPVGQIDGDASAVINAERGQMLLLGPNLAQYRGETGFTARLVRFPGPKHVWICS